MLDGQVTVETEPPVTFAFTVTNEGDSPVTVEFRDACRADFVVREGQTERWRWSDGRMFAQVLGELTLAPGEQETYTAVWERPESGTYTVRAELTGDEPCAAETTFTV